MRLYPESRIGVIENVIINYISGGAMRFKKSFYFACPEFIGQAFSQVLLFLKNSKLHLQQENSVPVWLVPTTKDQFFMFEAQKQEIAFKEDGSGQYFLFTSKDKQP